MIILISRPTNFYLLDYTTQIMNEINTNTANKHKRLRILLPFGSVIIAGLLLFWFISHRKDTPHGTDSNVELTQYSLLSPTNAIIKNYLVNEGELISKSSAAVLLIDPVFEQRIQQALTRVSNARLELEEKRVQSITLAKNVSPSERRIALQTRIQKKRDQVAIQNQKDHIQELSVALASFQAKLVELNSQPFGVNGNSEAIDATKVDITKFQEKLDMANVEIKHLQNKANSQMVQTGAILQDRDKTTVINRSIEIAKQKLKYEEAQLKDLQKQEPQFSTLVPAPFAGLIVENIYSKGTFVRKGQPILIMMQQDYN